MDNKYYQKKQRKASKRSTKKWSKSVWSRKRKKVKKALDRYKNLSEEEKKKKVEYVWNYYLACKKWFLGFYKVVWRLRIL